MPPVRNGRPPQNSNSKPLNVDRDDGGIYKARNNNYDNARTVPDNNHMYTDMPVDYRRANEVHNVNRQ